MEYGSVYIVIALFALIIIVNLSISIRETRAYNRTFANVSRELGLDMEGGTNFSLARLKGDIDGFRVKAWYEKLRKQAWYGRTKRKTWLRINIFYNLSVDCTFSIDEETTFSRMKKAVGFDDIIIGVDSFDDAFLIKASENCPINALLTYDVRKEITDLLKKAAPLVIYHNGINVYTDVKYSASIIEYVKRLVKLARMLVNITDPIASLAENICSDPVAEVRIRNIEALAKYYPQDDRFQSIIRTALEDEDPAVQAKAVEHVDIDAFTYLLEMISADKPPASEVSIAIVTVLKNKRYEQAIPALKILFRKSDNPDVIEETARAFQLFGTTDICPFLIEELGKNKSSVQVEIIRALGTCGTVQAVEPLFKTGKSSLNPIVRNAVQKAIGEIQSRLGGVDAGWLSIEELSDTDGALSIPDEAGAGSLSVNPKKEKN